MSEIYRSEGSYEERVLSTLLYFGQCCQLNISAKLTWGASIVLSFFQFWHGFPSPLPNFSQNISAQKTKVGLIFLKETVISS